MTISTLRSRLAAVFAVSLALALSASANQPPEKERGFKPELVYQFNGFDSVNLFNGNLNLSIPLASYPVSADVSYSFVLRYSGNVWSHHWECPQVGPGYPEDPPPCELWWTPQVDSGGLGWTVGFGKLRQAHSLYYQLVPGVAWAYTSPDGSEHLFYETLHEPKCGGSITSNCDPVDSGVWYTRDGSYLRLKEYNGYKIVEFPDGQRHRFLPVGGPTWRLDYIFGASSQLGADHIPQTNWVRFEYPLIAGHQFITDWKISDSEGRNHEVLFQASPYALVDKIRLAAPKRPEDPAGVTPIAEYNFTYNDYTIQGGVPVDGPMIPVKWPCDPNRDITDATTYLSRVDLPGGDKWEFDYAPSTQCEASGTMTRAILPTGGNIGWSYQQYFSEADIVWVSQGVKERCMRTDLNPCSTSASSEQQQYVKYTPGPEGSYTLVETYAKKANGSWGRDTQVKNYFAGRFGAAVGLPFGAALDNMNRNISTETFDCDPESNTCSAWTDRKQFVKYEMDSTANCNIDYPCIRDRNRRVVSERTEYSTDGYRVADTNYSLFDGLGHYRETKTDGSFNAGNIRESFTAYNTNTRNYDPDTGIGYTVGNYLLNSSGARLSGYTMLDKDDTWILSTYTTAYTREAGATTFSEACYDPVTGFLERTRAKRLDSFGNPNEFDLLTLYTRDPATGYTSIAETFGGDKQSVPTTALCGIEASSIGHNQYSSRTDYTYQYGSLKTTQQSGVDWPAVDNTIDKYTGLVLSSTDPAGATTTYEYDRLRRLTKVSPPAVSPTTYVYTPVTPSSPARVDAKTGTGTISTEHAWEFDPFGRIAYEKRLMPNNAWSVVRTTYDSLGRRASFSEAEAMAGAAYDKTTRYENYDHYGRVGTIIAPDGKSTSFSYTGDRVTTRTYQVAKPEGDTNVTIEEERDRAGRLIKVKEDSTGTPALTEYTYDEGNRLATVKMWNGGQWQPRTFTYDGAGLLTSEVHPESGSTSYKYDSRGLIVEKSTPMAELTHTYDGAGRLKTVSQTGVGTLKSYTYDRENNWTDLSMGKLDTATRYNRSTELGEVTVKETYEYGGVGGRLSRKDTMVTRPGEFMNFYDSYSYNSVGDMTSLWYPLCSTGACLSLSAPYRNVVTTYKHGLVTDVFPYTTGSDGVTYYPNGFVNAIKHRNVDGSAGPIQTFTIANKMARADSITVTNFCDNGNLSVTQPVPQPHSVPSGSPAGLSVNAPGATTYQWFRVVNGVPQPIGGQNSATLTSAVTETGTYFVRVGNGACTLDSERATVTVQACTPPDATISAPVTATASYLIYASVPSTSGATYQWTVSNGTITGGWGTSQISVGVHCSGVISISVIVTKNNCSSSDGHTVSINPPTISVTGSPTSINQGDTATITASFTGLAPWTVTWADLPPQLTYGPHSRPVTPGQTTTYSATATDSNGCPAAVNGSNSVTINVTACTPPNATISAPTSTVASNLVIASVPDSPGATYQWTVTGGVITSGAGTRQVTIRAGCSGAISIGATVSRNGCSSSDTHSVAITAPSVTVTGTATINQGSATPIYAALTGTAPWTVTWSHLPGQPVTTSTTPISSSVSPTTTTTYTATATDSNGCPATVNGSAIVTVVPPAPTNVVATAVTTTQVDVTWAFSGTADRFDIYRSGVFAGSRTMPGSLSFSDTGAAPSMAYKYTVIAIRGSQPSAASAPDLATTVLFSDDPVVANVVVIKAIHFTQLQAAANALRAALGWAPQTFTTVAPGMTITAAALEEIRSSIDVARSNLLLPAATYSRRPVTGGMVILGGDVNETRTAVR